MRVQIIAEAGVNHNGSLERAFALIDAARNAGADVVKFQTFKPELLVSRHAPKADYQKKTTGSDESQLDMLRKLALNEDEQRQLQQYCEDRQIEFLSTPFDPESLEFLITGLRLKRLKLGSGDLTNGPLLLDIARAGTPLILSTGMATLDEIKEALAVLAYGYTQQENKPDWGTLWEAFSSTSGQQALQDKVSLLHCTTEYPCPFNEVNLRAMDTLRETFHLPVGYSDHTPGIEISLAAVARGARIIEKHFTLDRNLPGPDHRASLEPTELGSLVQGIRNIEQALGDGQKKPADSELSNMKVARKSVVAARSIAAGELFTRDNITVKRPGTGQSPMRYWDMLGSVAEQDYAEDEVI